MLKINKKWIKSIVVASILMITVFRVVIDINFIYNYKSNDNNIGNLVEIELSDRDNWEQRKQINFFFFTVYDKRYFDSVSLSFTGVQKPIGKIKVEVGNIYLTNRKGLFQMINKVHESQSIFSSWIVHANGRDRATVEKEEIGTINSKYSNEEGSSEYSLTLQEGERGWISYSSKFKENTGQIKDSQDFPIKLREGSKLRFDLNITDEDGVESEHQVTFEVVNSKTKIKPMWWFYDFLVSH